MSVTAGGTGKNLYPNSRHGPDRVDGEPVALLKAYSKYVTFGLWKGQQITDPSAKLEAGSRQMASVKLASEQYVDEQLFTDWLRQARELEQES